MLNGGKGNGPSSIKTPAPKPKPVSGKPRYPVAKDILMLLLIRKDLWGVVMVPRLGCTLIDLLQSTAQHPYQLDRVLGSATISLSSKKGS